jgi:uncharacterized membrane protein required for colicin V production
LIFDIIVGAVIAFLAYRSAQLGALGSVAQLLTTAVAAILARIVATPAASFMLKAIDWSPGFAMGVAFLVLFLGFWVIATFLTSRAVEAVSDGYGDGGPIDQWMGFIVGVGRGALIGFALLASTILVTQRLAAKKKFLAIQYQNSRVATWVLTHNIIDPEPFPNARALLRLLQVTDGSESSRPHAMAHINAHPKVQAVKDDPQAVDAIRAEDWKALRKNRGVLELVTDQQFVAAADLYRTVRHKVGAEDPNERFDELDEQREELEP